MNNVQEICSKLKIKITEGRHRLLHPSGVFVLDFEEISHIILMFPYSTLYK